MVSPPPSKRLFVSNLHPDIDDATLGMLFSQFKPIQALVKRNHITNLSRGFGFVEFAGIDVASDALATLNGTRCMGMAIRVTFAGQREDFSKNQHSRWRETRRPGARPFVPRRGELDTRSENDAESDILQHEPPDPLAVRSQSPRSPTPVASAMLASASSMPMPVAPAGQIYLMLAIDPTKTTDLKSACAMLLKQITDTESV
jgi:RNA recognition motif-containing protein